MGHKGEKIEKKTRLRCIKKFIEIRSLVPGDPFDVNVHVPTGVQCTYIHLASSWHVHKPCFLYLRSRQMDHSLYIFV